MGQPGTHICAHSPLHTLRTGPLVQTQRNQADVGGTPSCHLAPILSQVTRATSHEPHWSMSFGMWRSTTKKPVEDQRSADTLVRIK